MGAILQQHPRVSCVDTITVVVPLRLDFVAADLPGLDVERLCGAQAGEACVPGGRGAAVGLLLPGGCPMGACAAGPTLPAHCPQIPGEYSVSGAPCVVAPCSDCNKRYGCLSCARNICSVLGMILLYCQLSHTGHILPALLSYRTASEQHHAAIACNRWANASTQNLPA